MSKAKKTLNELLVDLFNYILLLEETNIKQKGINLSMNEVHIVDIIDKISDNSMSSIAKKLMVTQGTLTTSSNRLVRKGFVERYKDEKDKRIVRLRLTEKAAKIIQVHDQFHNDMIDAIIEDLHVDDDVVLLKSLERVMQYFKQNYE